MKLLKSLLAETNEDIKAQDKQYHELVQTIVEMKREGFEPPPKTIELIPEKDLPAPIWEAINDISERNSREYYSHMAFAHEAIEAGSSEEEIINRILYGQDVDV